ncbi:hypothetical protein BDV06DRAFT_16189 [Aspergillus oleicola]
MKTHGHWAELATCRWFTGIEVTMKKLFKNIELLSRQLSPRRLVYPIGSCLLKCCTGSRSGNLGGVQGSLRLGLFSRSDREFINFVYEYSTIRSYSRVSNCWRWPIVWCCSKRALALIRIQPSLRSSAEALHGSLEPSKSIHAKLVIRGYSSRVVPWNGCEPRTTRNLVDELTLDVHG